MKPPNERTSMNKGKAWDKNYDKIDWRPKIVAIQLGMGYIHVIREGQESNIN